MNGFGYFFSRRKNRTANQIVTGTDRSWDKGCASWIPASPLHQAIRSRLGINSAPLLKQDSKEAPTLCPVHWYSISVQFTVASGHHSVFERPPVLSEFSRC